MDKKRIAVILPCYNEQSSVAYVIGEWLSLSPDIHVWFCDNNSTDKSLSEARLCADERLHIIQEEKQGKGNAVRAVLETADADVYILCDVDRTYPATMSVALPVINGECDMCIGRREGYFLQERKPANSIGNRIVPLICRLGTGLEIEDPLSGLRAFSKRFADTLELPGGFAMEAAMARHASRMGFRVRSVPVEYRPRPGDEPSKISFLKDGVKIVFAFFHTGHHGG